MLNHRPGGGNYLDWSPEGKAVVVRSAGPLRSGSQLYGSYGERASGDLLLSYGFVPGDSAGSGGGAAGDDDDVYDPKARRRGGGAAAGAAGGVAGRKQEAANPHEAAAVVLGINSQDQWAEAKAEALAARGARAPSHSVSSRNSVPPSFASHQTPADPQHRARRHRAPPDFLGQGRRPPIGPSALRRVRLGWARQRRRGETGGGPGVCVSFPDACVSPARLLHC